MLCQTWAEHRRWFYEICKLQFDLILKGRGSKYVMFVPFLYKFCFVPPFCFKFHLPPLSRDNISSQIHFFKCKHTETMKISYAIVSINIYKYFWISVFLSCEIWAGCSRLSANIGRFSNLAFQTQILHFVFVSAIFAVFLFANLNIIPQSGGRGGKIAVGDSKQQLDNTNTIFKIRKIQILKWRNANWKIRKY